MKRDARMAALAAGLALALPAHAQTPAQPPAGAPAAQQPMGASPGTQAPMGGQTVAMRPIASPQPGQMMGSDLRGADVYGMNNESIGEINDIVIDREGRVAAVVIGVGGFLGIGEKDVAVPYQALQIMTSGSAAANTSATGMDTRATGAVGTGVTGTGSPASGTGAAPGIGTSGAGIAPGSGTTSTSGTSGVHTSPGAVGHTGTNMMGTGAGGAGSATGPAATGAGTTGAGAAQRTATLAPDRIVLRGMTRADLENAPAFRSDGRAAR